MNDENFMRKIEKYKYIVNCKKNKDLKNDKIKKMNENKKRNMNK